MSTEAEELHRIIGASVRDMLDAYRLQAQAGPVTEQALEGILFRASQNTDATEPVNKNETAGDRV